MGRTRKTGETRRQFSHEYKLEAVRMMTEGGRAASAVARELGINANVLRRWRQQLTGGTVSTAPTSAPGAVTSQDEELRRLRRENAVLKQERDFLRAATVYFAKESR